MPTLSAPLWEMNACPDVSYPVPHMATHVNIWPKNPTEEHSSGDKRHPGQGSIRVVSSVSSGTKAQIVDEGYLAISRPPAAVAPAQAPPAADLRSLLGFSSMLCCYCGWLNPKVDPCLCPAAKTTTATTLTLTTPLSSTAVVRPPLLPPSARMHARHDM